MWATPKGEATLGACAEDNGEDSEDWSSILDWNWDWDLGSEWSGNQVMQNLKMIDQKNPAQVNPVLANPALGNPALTNQKLDIRKNQIIRQPGQSIQKNQQIVNVQDCP